MRGLVLAVVVAGCARPRASAERAPAPVAQAAVVPSAAAPAAAAPAPAPAPPDAAPAAAAAPAPAPPLAIVDAPMAWSDARAKLTLAYRRTHSDPAARDLTIDPHVIVLHYTGGGSAKATRAYFDNLRIEPARRELARAGAVNVSAHFVVDRDGTIYQLQPPTRYARHCIGLNHVAIGIENVGDEDRYPLTNAQVAADAALVRELAHRYRITHLLGHYEVMHFRTSPYYVERDPAYQNDKSDPGPRFMAAVRARVADLHLAGLP